MKLSTEKIKAVLSEKYSVSTSEIKRQSKSKNQLKQVVRVFSVDDEDVEVISDTNDEVILSINYLDDINLDEDEEYDENSSEFGSSDPKDYIFAVSSKKDKENDMFIVIITEKSKYKKGDRDCPDICAEYRDDDLIPDFLEDFAGNDSAVLGVNDPDMSLNQIIDSLESHGFIYNNDLAKTLEKCAEDEHCDKIKAYIK